MKQLYVLLKRTFVGAGIMLITFVVLQMLNGHYIQVLGWSESILPFIRIAAQMLLLIIICILICQIIFNSAMIVGGLISGFHFLRLSSLGFSITKHEGRLKFRRDKLTLGVAMGLPLSVNDKKSSYFWYNSCLFIACLATTIVTAFLFIKFYNIDSDYRIFILTSLAFIFLQCAIIVVRELISLLNPSKCDAVGISTFIKISKEENLRQVFLHFYQINNLLFEGKRMSEMPSYLFEDVPIAADSSYLEKAYRFQYCEYLADKQDYEQSFTALGDFQFYNDIKLLGELYLLTQLCNKFLLTRKPEPIKYLYEAFTLERLYSLKAYGALYAINTLCLRNEKTAESIKNIAKNDLLFTQDRVIIQREFNLVDELRDLGQFVDKPISKVKTRNSNRKDKIISSVIYTVFFLSGIWFHTTVENGLQMEINSVKVSIKEEMTNALSSNNCYDIQKSLIRANSFEKSLMGDSINDQVFYSLKKQCQERIDELDCDNERQDIGY